MSNTTLLQGVVGSKAYGLDTPDSDVDRLGIFAASTLEIAGLYWHPSKETRASQGPEQDEDFVEHEVGKFLRLALKMNPTITELLWLKDYEVKTSYGEMLRGLRHAVLSEKAVIDAYRGYAFSQMKKFKDGFSNPKYARHCLRLIEQGHGLWRDGFLQVRVDDPQRFFDLSDMTSNQVLDVLSRALDRWENSAVTSPLPAQPDVNTVAYVLDAIRLKHV